MNKYNVFLTLLVSYTFLTSCGKENLPKEDETLYFTLKGDSPLENKKLTFLIKNKITQTTKKLEVNSVDNRFKITLPAGSEITIKPL